jgi:hypothetical protein
MRQARHDQQLRHYHDRNVKETSFNVGDLALGASRRPTTSINSLPPGRDLSSSLKSSARQLIDSSGVKDKEYQILGTWSTYDDSNRRIVF